METIIKKGFLILLCGLALSLPSYADGADTIRVGGTFYGNTLLSLLILK